MASKYDDAARQLSPSACELSPYLEQYWEDFDCNEVYAAVISAIYVDQYGREVGNSIHLNGPFEGFNTEFMDDFLASFAKGGE